MGKYYVHDDGTPSPVPTSKKDAKRFKQSIYDSGEICPNCKTESAINGKSYISSTSRKYTNNDKCPGCARLIAIEFYNYAINASEFIDIAGPHLRFKRTDEMIPFSDELHDQFVQMKLLFESDIAPITSASAREIGSSLWVRTEPCTKAGHLGIRTLKSECYFCARDRDTPSSRKQAIINDEKWYMPNTECPHCHTTSLKRVSDNKCSDCHPRIIGISPRKQAITDGKKWYMPNVECIYCHTIAPKRVDNGQCSGCITSAKPSEDDARETPDSIMMRESPDLVISRSAARDVGFKVYRTGKPCQHDHTGFRYVSTGNCIKCLRGE